MAPENPLDRRIQAAALDPGKSEAIALALGIGADYVLLNDLPARLLADRQGLVVIGTLGVLLRAKDAQLISKIRPLLDDLRSANFFMSERLYRRMLRAVDQTD